MNKDFYLKQAELLLDMLPHIYPEKNLALKGGTAINLFFSNLPRLSIDIDLTYTGFEQRDTALENIETSIQNIKNRIKAWDKSIKTFSSRRQSLPNDVKLFIQRDNVKIKLEINPVIRGTVFEVKTLTSQSRADEIFNKEIIFNVLSKEDVYGGKIVAALDRQHPRDLFDMKVFLEDQKINESILLGFIIALISHKRPPIEVLNPILKDQSLVFKNEFLTMEYNSFSYQNFEATRNYLIKSIGKKVKANYFDFLISFFSGTPDWDLIAIEKIKDLPAVQWKLENINKMDEKSKSAQLESIDRWQMLS